jgi:phosphoserine phosphatase
VAELKECGYRVGCISSGVSQFFMKPFKERLDLDFAFSNTLGESDGKHDGQVLRVMGRRQKAEVMMDYVNELKVSRRSLASVGDGENDMDLFTMSGFSIAFNPVSETVSKAATVTIRSKDLRDVLPHLTK